MTNSYDVDHGLSQDEPGPLGLEAPDDTLARTGNTARDQEMYAAGRAVGEENAKHNAAIRGAWLPIESAPKDGTSILARGPQQDTVVIAWNAWALPEAEWRAVGLEAHGFECPRVVMRGEPTLWQPLPADPCPTCNDQGAVGNILTAQPCPDCAAPASPVSTVEQGETPQQMPDPTQADLGDPVFEAIWQIIKAWDVNAPAYYAGYCGANGSHVKLILDAIRAVPDPAAGDARDAHFDLLQDDMVVASASGPRAQALEEIQHFAAVYSEDGPVQIEEVIRIPLSAANAAQRQGDA